MCRNGFNGRVSVTNPVPFLSTQKEEDQATPHGDEIQDWGPGMGLAAAMGMSHMLPLHSSLLAVFQLICPGSGCTVPLMIEKHGSSQSFHCRLF